MTRSDSTEYDTDCRLLTRMQSVPSDFEYIAVVRHTRRKVN